MEVWNESRSNLFPKSIMGNGEVLNIPLLQNPFPRTIDPRGLYLNAGAGRYLAGGGVATVMP